MVTSAVLMAAAPAERPGVEGRRPTEAGDDRTAPFPEQRDSCFTQTHRDLEYRLDSTTSSARDGSVQICF
ncbi:UNVERIFIED_CONTAM: hypothetical protein FKN15_025222 [Acipenser sinensis]